MIINISSRCDEDDNYSFKKLSDNELSLMAWYRMLDKTYQAYLMESIKSKLSEQKNEKQIKVNR